MLGGRPGVGRGGRAKGPGVAWVLGLCSLSHLPLLLLRYAHSTTTSTCVLCAPFPSSPKHLFLCPRSRNVPWTTLC